MSPGQALQQAMPSVQSDDFRLSMSKPLQDLLYSTSKFMRLGLAKSTINMIHLGISSLPSVPTSSLVLYQ